MTTATNANKKLYGLDHLRAFAIIFVFLFHYGRLFPHPEWTNAISKFGWTGVDLFFVLSGYLIASQLFSQINKGKKISLKVFFTKRSFRIIPAYLVVVSLYFLFPFTHEREALAPLWKYLIFIQNIGLDIRTQGTFSHAWSLCIEEQFYLLLPLILIALVYFKLSKKGFWLLIVLFLSGFIIRFYSYQHFCSPFTDDSWFKWYEWIYYATWCRLDDLLMGVSIAALLEFKPVLSTKILKRGNTFLTSGLLIFAATYFVCSNEEGLIATVFGFPLVSIGYGCIVLGALSPNCFLYRVKSNITSKIAALSYGIYLIHKMVIHVTQTQFSRLNLNSDGSIMFIVCIATVFIASLLLNEIIEKPFLRLRKKILVREKAELNNVPEPVSV